MAILFFDGFDHMDTSSTTGKGFFVTNTTLVGNSDFTPHGYGKSARVDSNGFQNGAVYHPCSAGGNSVTLGFMFRFVAPAVPNTGEGAVMGAAYCSPANATQVGVFFNEVGDIRVARVSNVFSYPSTNILATASSALTSGTWHRIEIKITVSDSISAGDFIVKVDGSEVINLTAGSDTKFSAGAQTIVGIDVFGCSRSSGQVTYIDDLWMSNGGTFLGDTRVITVFPDADGSASDFSPSSGSDNYAMVDDNPSDGDTTYNSSSTSNHEDLFAFGDSPVDAETVYAVSIGFAARHDASAVVLSGSVKHGTATGRVATAALGSSYAKREAVFEQNPDTTSAWTNSDLATIEAGYRLDP